jgi:hypothetical protein
MAIATLARCFWGVDVGSWCKDEGFNQDYLVKNFGGYTCH